MKLKKIIKFLRRNYVIPIIFAIFLLVGLVTFYRIAFSKSEYVYAKIKVGQGLWWANTQKPSIWQLNAINEGDVAKSAFGSPTAIIKSKKYYRFFGSDQYDIYLTMMLKVEQSKKTGSYTFDRAVLSVGSPVDIQFPSQEITGTVIGISTKPFEEKLVEKTVTLVKKYAYPWEYENIRVGDKFTNGKEVIFEVLNKEALPSSGEFSYGNRYTSTGQAIIEPSNYISVKARVLLKKVNEFWIFGEDQIVSPGRSINAATENFVYDNYVITRVD